MTSAIRFGKLETLTTIATEEGIEVISRIETIHDYSPTNVVTKRTRSDFADSRKKVIAEMLKLMDSLNDEDVIGIVFECDKQSNNSKSPFKYHVTHKIK